MATRNRTSAMEEALRDLLTYGVPVWIPDNKIDMKIFTEYPRAKTGIAVYYPIYKDGSCASPIFVKFFRSPHGMSIELATEHEYSLQEKERLGFLLRH